MVYILPFSSEMLYDYNIGALWRIKAKNHQAQK